MVLIVEVEWVMQFRPLEKQMLPKLDIEWNYKEIVFKQWNAKQWKHKNVWIHVTCTNENSEPEATPEKHPYFLDPCHMIHQ